MKTAMLVLGTMATVAMAQGFSGFTSLPACGQTCVTNMVSKADTLHCNSNDLACLCQNADFSYGIRDCTNESCPSDKDSQDTQSWGIGLCANQGVVVTSGSTAAAASTETGSSVSPHLSVTSSVTATISSSGSVITTVVPTVVPLVSTDLSASTESAESTGSTETATGITRTSAAASRSANGGPAATGGNFGQNDAPGAAHGVAVPLGIMVAAGLAAILI